MTLPVIGDVAAGDPERVTAIRAGLCARIMTGAPLPAGADAIIPVEWTDGGTAKVTIRQPGPAGHYIRRAGEDVTAGQVVLRGRHPARRRADRHARRRRPPAVLVRPKAARRRALHRQRAASSPAASSAPGRSGTPTASR